MAKSSKKTAPPAVAAKINADNKAVDKSQKKGKAAVVAPAIVAPAIVAPATFYFCSSSSNLRLIISRLTIRLLAYNPLYIQDKKSKKAAKPPTPPPEPEIESDEDADETDEDDSSEDESDEEPSKANAVKPAAVVKANGAAEQGSSEEDSDEDDEDDGDEDEDSEDSEDRGAPPKRIAPPSSGEDSDEESEDDDDEDDDEEDEEDEEDDDEDGEEEKVVAQAKPVPAAKVNAKRKSEAEGPALEKKARIADPDHEASTNIFVGQLSWNVDDDWLASEFADCGEIVSAKVIMDRESGRSRGFGYVQFADLDAAAKAVDLNEKEVDGRSIRVNYSKPQERGAPAAERRANARGDQLSAPSDTLFVAGLSYSLTEDQLYEAFADHGDVQSVRLPTDRETGAPKGIAYVQFSSHEGATAGLALQAQG
ncbi:MAG: hypothetical protein TREMPRED_004963 [Tremellales sp. Tagirdzhanova-0007]|nr:MAG: hypothetical protein TREMPRED_004963 [Tremellales sp. Tagirdzhanova-0007]